MAYETRGRGASNKTVDPRLAQAAGGSQSIGAQIGRANIANPDSYASYSRSQRAPQFIQPGDGTPRSTVSGDEYAAQFQASLARDRAAIDAQLKGALEALQGRRDQAAGLIATLPQTAGANYDEALGQLQGAQAQGLTGLSSDVRVEQDMTAPLVGALQANKAGSKATQPFLNLAATARHDQSAAGLESAGISAHGDLSAQERSFLMQQQQQQQEVDHFQEQMAWERERHYSTLGAEERALAAQQDAAQDQWLRSEYGIGLDESNAALASTQGRQALSYLSGESSLITTERPNAVGRGLNWLRGDDRKNRWQETGTRKATPVDIAKRYKDNKQLLRALVAQGHLSPADLEEAGVTL